jgi:hypothetical protein
MISFDLFTPEKHYDLVSDWWKFHGWNVLPLTHLSQTGIVVNFDGIPSAAAWIYRTDSAFCLLEWIVASPEIRREKRTEVLNALISKSKEVAKNMGFKSIFVTARHESLISRLTQNEFQVCDTGMKNLIFNIGGA